MSDNLSDYSDVIRRAREGDDAAVRLFLEKFEPEVRVMVRTRLPRKMRKMFDSLDFVQQVWGSFLLPNTDRDEPSIATYSRIRAYLGQMVENKVTEEYRRRTKTKKFNLERERPLVLERAGEPVEHEIPSREPSPSQHIQADERIKKIYAGRTPAEKTMIQLRIEGLTFVEIASRVGCAERTVRRFFEHLSEREGVGR